MLIVALRVLARCWPALLAWYLLGWALRFLIIRLAAFVANANDVAGLLILPVAILAQLVAFVGMFLAVRRELRHLARVDDVEPQVMEVVRAHFRPEFLNRLDEIILFHRLAAEHMAPIVDIQVARVQALLKDRKITLDLTEGARAWLGRVGYDPVYGARPLKRAVQKYLQDPLADAILRGEVRDGATVKVDEGDGALKIEA